MYDSILGEVKVSWITILLNHVVFDVASFDRRAALKFCFEVDVLFQKK